MLHRSCWVLAQTYSQLPRDLFNAAFVSVWTHLTQAQQAELIQSLQQALLVPDLPEVTQTILNLAEFMEHCDKVCLSQLLFIAPLMKNSLFQNTKICVWFYSVIF